MKPAPFDYHRPGRLGEAAELLGSLEDAKVLAGGQSLVPILALRLSRFEHVVDIGGVDELRGIARNDGVVSIGATTTQAEVGEDETVAAGVPLLAKATPLIGHFQIRNRGTLGGSIAHADPAAEYPAVAAALDATMVLTSASGTRRVPAADFFQATFTTAAAEDEILTSVQFPVWEGPSGFAAREVARRHGDFALVGAVAGVALQDGRIGRAAIALFGVAGTPYRARQAEAALVGQAADGVDVSEAGRLVSTDLDPPDDIHASGAYRREVAAVVVERVLTDAIQEAMNHA